MRFSTAGRVPFQYFSTLCTLKREEASANKEEPGWNWKEMNIVKLFFYTGDGRD